MNYYILLIKSTIRMDIFLAQIIPQGQPLLFEFWSNEITDNTILTTGNIFKQIQGVMRIKTTVNELNSLAKLN